MTTDQPITDKLLADQLEAEAEKVLKGGPIWGEGETIRLMKAAAQSLRRAPAPVRVKALEWRDDPNDGGREYARTCLDNEYGIKTYSKSPFTNNYNVVILVMSDGGSFQEFAYSNGDDSQARKSAKAAAQADYDQHILSALEP